MTVLLDANIWVSALKFGGVPLQVLRVAIQQDTLLTCPQLRDEILETMAIKFGVPKEALQLQLAEMLEGAVDITLTGKLRGICRDPEDDYLLECAVTGAADVIVTGDKDLLSLETYEGVRILTPRQYLDEARLR